MSDTTNDFWYCTTHKRVATHTTPAGERRCDPSLAGVMLPCRVKKHDKRNLVNPEWVDAEYGVNCPAVGTKVGVFSRLEPDGTRVFGDYVLDESGRIVEKIKSQT